MTRSSSSFGARQLSFSLSLLGAALMAIGCILTWGVYYPFTRQGFSWPIKGIDISPWGKVLLAAAVVAIVCSLLLRKGKGNESRRGFGPALLALGLVSTVTATVLLLDSKSLMKPTDASIVRQVLQLTLQRDPKATSAKVLAVLTKAGWGSLSVGPGPIVVLIGAVLLAVGGFLSVRWARSTKDASGVAGLPLAPLDAGADAPDPSSES